VIQRFVEHIGAARRGRTTLLAKDLHKYGPSVFEIEEVERCDLKISDEREAFYIQKYNTLKPFGYNFQSSSRNNKGSVYIPENIIKAEMKGIKCGNEIALIRVLISVEGQHKKKENHFRE
jgi:hypothetical protein